MTKIREIIDCIEKFAPPQLQESYDNSGLQVGNADDSVTAVLITLDVTLKVVREAIEKGCNLIISHHPLLFLGLKKINSATDEGKIIVEAVKNNITIYSCHTNLDSVGKGVSYALAQKIGLKNCKILEPQKDIFRKLVVYAPENYADSLRTALFDVGCGTTGNYKNCSFNSVGVGTFCGNNQSNPFVGKKNEIHNENEIKIETIFPFYRNNDIVKTLIENHPYKQPAFDIFTLNNDFDDAGFGIIGDLEESQTVEQFMINLKNAVNAECIRYSSSEVTTIKRVAVCGGSGAFLIKKSAQKNADIFVTADVKYHNFFDFQDKMIIADIGHYESEQFAKEIFFEIISKNFYNFAALKSEINSNPIKYFSK